jgi:hypothetical protein
MHYVFTDDLNVWWRRHSFCFIYVGMNASTLSLHFVGFGMAYSGVDLKVAWGLFVLGLYRRK